MPHATMPATGFQAIILCGSGESLNPFNSNPKDFPKALIPIANRPMVWYPLEWCYRLGITNITLVTPPICASAISNALSQNPHLTSLPSPKPTLLSPGELTLTTGTAELFRLKEVQDAIVNDFILLPCDIVCELPGTSLLDIWMIMQSSLGGEGDAGKDIGLTSSSGSKFISSGLNGEKSGRRGGLGMWYHTKDPETGSSNFGIKNEETDFIATTVSTDPVVPSYTSSLRPYVRNLAMSMPTSELNDILEDKSGLNVRHALLKLHGMVKMQMTCRDAHVYYFPYWVKELLRKNDTFESVADVIGCWAKSTWQHGLASKLGLNDIFDRANENDVSMTDDDIDISRLSTTSTVYNGKREIKQAEETMNNPRRIIEKAQDHILESKSATAPRFLSYIHPPAQIPTPGVSTETDNKQKVKASQQQPSIPDSNATSQPFIRRVDTVPLLLATSLYLASLPAIDSNTASSSPFSVPTKKPTSTPLPPQSSIHTSNVLLDINISLSPKLTLSHCVIGANCTIGSGVRISRSVLMEGVTIEDGVKLDGCVLGRRCKIGKGSDLRDCWIQEGFVISGDSVSKGEIFAGFEGGELEDDGDAFADDD